LLEKIQIKTRREGSTLYLSTVLPDPGSGFSWFNDATLDLTVVLPASLAVELEDSSGDVKIERRCVRPPDSTRKCQPCRRTATTWRSGFSIRKPSQRSTNR
jgi:hypothetical protein